MTNSVKKTSLQEAQKARDEYVRIRRERSGAVRAEIAAPSVPGIIDVTDGTLTAAAVRADLDVIIPEWDQYASFDGDSDVVTLEWARGHTPVTDDFKPVANKTLTAPINPAVEFPVTLKVPVGEMAADGPYTLRYHVRTANGEDAHCANVPIICDSTPPWKHYEPGALALPVTQLTDAELANMPNGMIGTLPDYAHADWQAGDKVYFWWLTPPLPDDPERLPLPLGTTGVSGPTGSTVTFPRAALDSSLDQDYYAAYILEDKAGNRSPLSVYTRVDVALGALPSALQLPVVPLAETDGLINLPDARAGVDVHIPLFDNFKPRDRIEVTWGTTQLPSAEIGSSPVFPFSIRVPAAVLNNEYSQTIGGEQATNVSYRVLRGSLGSAVQAISVDVDFSYIGPDPVPNPDPDWPDPINDQLPVPEVYGKTSATKNTLTRADAGQNAELRVRLYDPLNEDEVMDFYWGSQGVVAQYIVKDTDSAGDLITVEIPWDDINKEGNNSAVSVYYEIHAAGSENSMKCEPIDVAVDAITLVPAGPAFIGTNPSNGWLTCVSLYEDSANPDPREPAVRVSVPDLSKYLNAGDKVTVTWIALAGRVGETPIAAAEKTEEITLDDAKLEGFTWYVTPYTTHILPIYDPDGAGNTGRARIKYEFDLAGETIVSDITEIVVAMYFAGGSCPIPPNP